MSTLQPFVNKQVTVLTSDGRILHGILTGFDQTTNLILTHTVERTFSLDKPTEINELGLYLIRGDNVALCGEVDEEVESKIDWTKVRAAPIKETKHFG